MHVPDEILLEMIDPATGEPVPPGAIGEVVVTLPSPTYPLVRFATGDLSILSGEPCPCGRTSPRLLKLVGRVDQVTKIKGMFVHPEQVTQLAGKVGGVASAQFVVTAQVTRTRWRSGSSFRRVFPPRDELKARIIETTREITRLRGEVRFIAAAEVEERGEEDHRQKEMGLRAYYPRHNCGIVSERLREVARHRRARRSGHRRGAE